ncbi:MAG: hypothetical protein VB111_12980 [Clostridiaceae bacterium]|nr:hypothetical protein [Clostridiaceae bacterium]
MCKNKRRGNLWLVFLLMLSGCSCVNGSSLAETDSSGDFQYYLNENDNYHNVAETESGFYICIPNRILFVDKKTMTPVMLCAKPNCPHTADTKSTCDAFFSGFAFSAKACVVGEELYVFYYNTETRRYSITKVSQDGSVRKELLSLDHNSCNQFVVHRGKIYVTTTQYDENGTSIDGLWEYSLENTLVPPVLIYERKASDMMNGFGSLLAYEDYLYFIDYDEENSWNYSAYLYHIPTRKLSKLSMQEDDASTVFLTIYDHRVIITRYRRDDQVEASYPDSNLYSYAPDGSDRKELGEFPHSMTASDFDYFYQRDSARGNPYIKDKCYRVYDEEYQPVMTVSMENLPGIEGLPSFSLLYPTNSEYVLLYAVSAPQARHYFYYIRKEDIKSGNAEVHELFSFTEGEY